MSVYVYVCRPEIDIMYFPLSPYSLRQCLFNQTKLTSVASCWTVCSWDPLPLPCEVRNTGELSRSPSIYGIQCLSSCCVTSALTPETFPQFQSVVPDKLHQGHLRVCRNCSSSDPIPTERAQGAVCTLRMGVCFSCFQLLCHASRDKRSVLKAPVQGCRALKVYDRQCWSLLC